jgi:predicted HicB family RNase H-like nuclease
LIIAKYDADMAKQKTSRMGRPRFPAGKAKTKPVFVRLTPALYEAWSEAAKREGKPLATWMRDTLAQLLKGE